MKRSPVLWDDTSNIAINRNIISLHKAGTGRHIRIFFKNVHFLALEKIQTTSLHSVNITIENRMRYQSGQISPHATGCGVL